MTQSPAGDHRSAIPIVEAHELCKTYLQGAVLVEALRDVSLAVMPGEIVAVMGPSGCGKSTFLSLLGAMDTPTQGRVFIEGIDLSILDDTQRTHLRRRRLGFVFQAFNLLPILTALQNVALPLELDGIPSQLAQERALGALRDVGLEHRSEHLPTMLSGGEQQRVAIARAIVAQPAVLLADEPTGNLDSVNARHVLDLIQQLVVDRQQTVVMVTHDPGIGSLADRIVHLRDGRIEQIVVTGVDRPRAVDERREIQTNRSP